MSLLVYNLTAAPLVLANGLSTTIPASTAGAGVRGRPWYASGGELKGLTAPQYIALQAQQALSSGVGDALAVAGVNVTLTDAAGAFVANNVGQFITINGATTPANNGSFLVTARTATTITFTNAAGVAEAYTGTYSLPGLMECEWEQYEEYPTQALVVGSAQKDIADLDLAFYADTTLGLDTNPGTQALPVKTVAKLLNLIPIGGWKRACNLFMAPGAYTYSEAGGWVNAFRGSGTQCAPPALIGAYSTVFGPVAVTAVNTDGSVDVPGIAALTSGVGVVGDAISFTAGSPSGTLAVAAGGFVAAGVKAGMSVTIAGAGVNNGTFLITAVTVTTLVYTNAAGIPGTVSVLGATYNVTVDRYFGVPRMTVVSGPGVGQTRLCAGNTPTALLPHAPFTISGFGAGITAGAPATLVINAGVSAVAGAAFTITGAANPANNGPFTALTVLPNTPVAGRTTITYTNGAAVTEADYGGFAYFTGSVIQLETPSVTITLTQPWIQPISQAGYKGITFKTAGAAASWVVPEAGAAFFEGCIIDLTAGGQLVVTRGGRLNGSNQGPWVQLGALNPFSNLRNNGLFIDGLPGTNNGLNLFNMGVWLNFHVVRNLDIGCNTNSFISVVAHGRNASFTISGASTLTLGGTSATARAKFSGNRAGSPWIFGLFDNATLIRSNFIDLTNCIGNPVQVGQDDVIPTTSFVGRSGSKANLGDVAGLLNNTGVGIKYTKGSYVVIDASQYFNSGDSLTFAAGSVTLAKAGAGFVAAGIAAGMLITITGATVAANNGTFPITAVTPTTIVYTNAAGVTQAGYAGTYTVNTGFLTTVSGVGGNTEGRRVGADTQTYATVRTADGSGVKGYQDPYLNRIEPPV